MKYIIALLSFIININAYSQAANIIPDYSMERYDAAIQKTYQNPALKRANKPNRIAIISAEFLGKPYLNDALGEGKNARFDQHPLYRTDAFDCLTYVSTVLALAESNSLAEFQKNMLKIQYFSATPTFVNRLHFTDADWNKVNTQNGFIQDITRTIKNEKNQSVAQFAEALINKPNWYKNLPASRLNFIHPLPSSEENERLAELHQLSKQVKAQKVSVSYIPLTALFNKKGEPNRFLFNQIPSGSIIEIVRPNWDVNKKIGTHLNISHLGFAILTERGLIFREASSLEHRVINVSLIRYLKGYLHNSTVQGINIQKVI